MGGKKNSIVVNILHLFYSTALSSGLNALALIVLAGYLQSNQYGLFSVALAFAMIMSYFTDAGLSDIVLREGAKQEVGHSRLLTSYMKMRLLLLILTFALGFFVIYIMNGDNAKLMQTAFVLIVPMVTGVALQSIGTTYFQLIEKMQYYGLIRLVSATALVLSMSVGMFLQWNPLLVTAMYGGSYLTAGIVAIILVGRHVRLSFTEPFHRGLLKNLGAFTIGGLLFVLLPHLGPILLEKTISLAEVGLFAVAYRIPQALQQIPFVVAGAYYPVLFRTFQNDQLNDHRSHQRMQVKIMALIGMMMTIPFFYFNEEVIRLLFGEQWSEAALPLKILSLMLTLQAVNIALADGLTSMERQNARTIIQAIAILIGAFLYIGWSSRYGVLGAAFAGVTIECIGLIGFWVCTRARSELFKRVLFPYLSLFAGSLWMIDVYLGGNPWAAVTVHLTIMVVLIALDQELRLNLVKAFSKYKRVMHNGTTS
ncbi:oligosaccharide flippase family protein [Halobacillus locisalis]|uniref:Oligosaccharide flippase family protein n=1 Tax=Halobacillus locisalis TaxID=220753 RepID=A0A838CWP9_9BACI|nr:oligosaccharide flippase family protein [Halobacillus locisalis]MBA2176343.1 oligosaccharide flippase family protein [Halobacillus locisalis]